METLQPDPSTTDDEHFKLVILQTEMERVRFLVRAYLRTRLAKVRYTCRCRCPGVNGRLRSIANTSSMTPLFSHASLARKTSMQYGIPNSYKRISSIQYWTPSRTPCKVWGNRITMAHRWVSSADNIFAQASDFAKSECACPGTLPQGLWRPDAREVSPRGVHQGH